MNTLYHSYLRITKRQFALAVRFLGVILFFILLSVGIHMVDSGLENTRFESPISITTGIFVVVGSLINILILLNPYEERA
jgi:uncharacterized integral membrane protein